MRTELTSLLDERGSLLGGGEFTLRPEDLHEDILETTRARDDEVLGEFLVHVADLQVLTDQQLFRCRRFAIVPDRAAD